MVVVVVAGLYSAERRVGVCVCVCEGVMWKKGAIKRRVVKEGWGGSFGSGAWSHVEGCSLNALSHPSGFFQ